LIDAAKELCRHIDACGLMLQTSKFNQVGNSLFPSVGFVLDEPHNNFYWGSRKYR